MATNLYSTCSALGTRQRVNVHGEVVPDQAGSQSMLQPMSPAAAPSDSSMFAQVRRPSLPPSSLP